jgi:hypothetical protein
MKEEWKFVVDDVDFNGAYMISNKGRVKSMTRKINSRYGPYKTIPEKILSLNKDKNTHYVSITLSLAEGRYNRSIHRLVAKAFLNNPEEKCCVNHKDGIRSNNNLDNLEWVTLSENALHGRANKRQKLSWSREEHVKDIKNCCEYIISKYLRDLSSDLAEGDIDQWIKENLP